MSAHLRSILLLAGGVFGGLLLSLAIRSCGTGSPTDGAHTHAATSHASAHSDHQGGDEGAAASAWVCPMHPQIRQLQPGTCPICFMDLVPQQAAPSDRADTLPVTPEAAGLMNIMRSAVERVPVHRRVEAIGRVAIADDGGRAITAWLPGRIEQVYVRNTGDRVRAGQRLASIYSPELVQAQQTLRRAQATLAELGDEAEGADDTTPLANARARSADTRRTTALSTIRSVQEQLLLLGLSASQVEDIVAAQGVERTITIRAPASGTLLDAPIQPGQYVVAGSPLVNLADLEQVWIELDVFIGDAALIEPGQSVSVRAVGSDRAIEASVDSIEPVTPDSPNFLRVRAIAPNIDGAWRPGTRVLGDIVVPWPGERAPASVPAQAVLWGGERSLVYVWDATVDPPVVMPIEVQTEFGWVDTDEEPRAVIHSGVFPGETVITNGTFRLDAELQLRGGPSLMNGAAAAGAHHGGNHGH